MRSLLAKNVLAAFLGTCVLSAAAQAADSKKKPEADNLYVSSWETGNKQFFTVSGWHGTKNYWMAGKRHGKMKDAKKGEPAKK